MHDICKSGETTAQHLKDLATATDSNDAHALKHGDDRKPKLPKDPRDSKNATQGEIKHLRIFKKKLNGT